MWTRSRFARDSSVDYDLDSFSIIVRDGILSVANYNSTGMDVVNVVVVVVVRNGIIRERS